MSGSAAQEEDIVVLRKVARGDRDALGELYDRYSGLLLALGLRIVANRREVEDVLHDVFLEAWRCAGDYDPARGSVKTWLAVRMRSRCLDRIRAHVNARTEVLTDLQEPEAAGVAENRLDGARVCALLDGLPEAQRKVLELGYFAGLSCQQIADELGIPLGTVKSRVATAMIKLRKDLGLSQGGTAA
ncbi:MAG TPA: sigma-70 family RNA polymerase sigma factor [Polyangiales bacterium]